MDESGWRRGGLRGRGAGGADFEGGSGEAVKVEPAVADEGACACPGYP